MDFKIYMKYIFAVAHETAWAEDHIMCYTHHGKTDPKYSLICYVLHK